MVTMSVSFLARSVCSHECCSHAVLFGGSAITWPGRCATGISYRECQLSDGADRPAETGVGAKPQGMVGAMPHRAACTTSRSTIPVSGVINLSRTASAGIGKHSSNRRWRGHDRHLPLRSPPISLVQERRLEMYDVAAGRAAAALRPDGPFNTCLLVIETVAV